MSLYICLALVGRFSPTQSTNSNSIPSLVDKSDDSAVRNGVSRGSSDLSIVPGEGIHTYQKVRTEFVFRRRWAHELLSTNDSPLLPEGGLYLSFIPYCNRFRLNQCFVRACRASFPPINRFLAGLLNPFINSCCCWINRSIHMHADKGDCD